MLLAPAALRAEEAGEALFHEQVAPIFERHCLNCHNERDRKGGFSLATGSGLHAGGDSGWVVAAGDPEASYLLDLITPWDDEAEMPQGGPPLLESEVDAIRRWIAAGAPWPEDRQLQSPVWWSLAPLQRPALPDVSSRAAPPASIVRNPVDAYGIAALRERGLSPAPEADRRTLIRRLSFDLLGLPPSSAEVEAFVADRDPHAYERLVDRMLASPHYGERWARHWLDVVRYGETHGYDKDKPREHAWPYRDYVIRSLNEDKPYGRFVQEQIAGDILFPNTRDGIEALGFIAAGPWDFIGHVEVPETKIDGKVARHLDRDDMVQNAVGTFLSLTVGCAQCHDHKFDPIPQADYYALQAMFAALDREDRPYDVDPRIAERRAALLEHQQQLEELHQTLTAKIAEAAGPQLAALDEKIAAANDASAERPSEYGYHSAIAPTPDETKWVQVDLGEPVQIARVEFVGCDDDFNGIGAGFGFPVRYKIELSDDPDFQEDVIRIADQTHHDVQNPGTAPQGVEVALRTARYVRFTATRLAPRQNDYILALAELRVLDTEGENRALDRPVTALDSVEAPVRWQRQNLVDGLHPGAASTAADREELERQRTELVAQRVAPEIRAELAACEAERGQVREEIDSLPPPRQVYAGCIHHGSGAFRGTGPDGGMPRPIFFLARGDVTQARQEVAPGVLSCLDEQLDPPQLPTSATDGQRRVALAQWLSDPRNPLTWRSIANRLWLYHFGRGLVDTPNDFGRMGERPTHPELLDWLACEIRDSDGSLKRVQRLIVTSATYRQRSAVAPSPESRDVDPENRFYWRMNRRQIEAEAVRDAILVAAGRLDRRMGGPSYRDFVIEKPEHSPHYQYHLHDPNDPQTQRRSIYRLIVRSQTQPLLTALDCADPSMQVARRNQSNTPLQSLALLNNQLPLAMSHHCAARARQAAGDLEGQVAAAFRHALSRQATEDELSALVAYARRHGLTNTCRAIINLNEFMFVD